jgi:hypothetical protein
MKIILTLFTLGLLSVALYSCGGKGLVPETQTYNGMGSRWQATLNPNGTFAMSELDNSIEVSGTWTETSSKWMELTVSDATGAGAPSAGSKAHALLIPGVVLLVKPFDGSQMITMVLAGTCPTSDMNANWVKTNIEDGADINTVDIYGTFRFFSATSSAILPNKFQLDGTDQGQYDLSTFSCSDGIATISDGRMYFSEIGAALVHTSVSDSTQSSFIVGLPVKKLNTKSVLAGDYNGLVYQQSTGSEELFPVTLSLNTSGSGTAYTYNNNDPNQSVNTSSGAGFAISNVDSPTDGFIKGTVTDESNNSATIRCMANTNINGSGKTFLFCAGANPGEQTKMYNLLLISK